MMEQICVVLRDQKFIVLLVIQRGTVQTALVVPLDLKYMKVRDIMAQICVV